MSQMPNINAPGVIVGALFQGADLAVSLSGGKDSQAMAHPLYDFHSKLNFPGSIYAIHMDLGRVEWPQTAEHVRRIARKAGLHHLKVVSRPQGDLLQQIQDRMKKLKDTGKPFWPSAAARYCTSDQKRSQADKVYRKSSLIISAEGIRNEESHSRAKKQPVSIRKSITAKRLKNLTPREALMKWNGKERLALNWYPILHWTTEEVWWGCGTSILALENRRRDYAEADGIHKAVLLDMWPAHPAYMFGNDRLSCALCILGSKNDLQVGARHNPDLWQTYRDMEEEGGFTFKHGFSLAEVDPTAPQASPATRMIEVEDVLSADA